MEKGKCVRRLFLFLCPDRKQNNGWLGKWALELEIPLLLSCSRFGSMSSGVAEVSWPRARSPGNTRREEVSLCPYFAVPRKSTEKPLLMLHLFSTSVNLYARANVPALTRRVFFIYSIWSYDTLQQQKLKNLIIWPQVSVAADRYTDVTLNSHLCNSNEISCHTVVKQDIFILHYQSTICSKGLMWSCAFSSISNYTF